MAISKDSKIVYTDLKSKYDSFNTFITNYGGSIAKLTVPANSPHPVDDADINNLNGKINEFKSDTYLKTQTSWWVNKTVTAGNVAYASDWTNINTTVSNFSKVKCRNSGTNSYTFKTNNCTQGTKNHNCNTEGKHSHNCNPDGKHSHNCNPDGKHSHNCNPDGKHSHNCNPDGKHSHNCTDGTCSNTSGASDGGTSGWTGCYATCTGLAGFSVSPANQSNGNGCGYNVSITYSSTTATCNSQYNRSITFRVTGTLAGKHYRNVGAQGATLTACNHTWQDWSAKFSGYTSRTATACSFGSNSVSCSNGNRNVSCSNGNRNVSCSNGNRNVSCSNGNRNVSCSNGNRNVACAAHGSNTVSCQNVRNSNTTFIDITCNHTSRTHG